jgi:outer membrane lipoprotein-sorting protein
MPLVHLPNRTRWLAPVAAAVVVTVATLAPADGAAPTRRLPAVTSFQLLNALAATRFPGLSGTAQLTVRLGFPRLPLADRSVLGLLSGSNTVQIWLAPDGRLRLALLRPLEEQDLIVRPGALWFYDSTTGASQVTRLARTRPGAPFGSAALGQLAGGLLPRVVASVGPDAAVAGRPCYQLDLTPTVSDSLIRLVRIAVDAASGFPLRLQVFGSSRRPAISLAFTSVQFRRPADRVFAIPPTRAGTRARTGLSQTALHLRPRAGWDAVLEISGLRPDSGLLQLFRRIAPSGSLATRLLSVLLTADGALLVGPARLDVLAGLAG